MTRYGNDASALASKRTSETAVSDDRFGPWNPGITSRIPRDILPLSSMFRDANVETSFEQAHELADLTGLSPFECVQFKPERLLAHEVLVRVTADLSVPDGPNYEDLGISMRGMVSRLLDRHVLQNLPELSARHEELRRGVHEYVSGELNDQIFGDPRNDSEAPSSPPRGWLRFLRRPPPQPARPLGNPTDRAWEALTSWRRRVDDCETDLEKHSLQCMVRIVEAILGHRGRLVGDLTTIADLVVAQVSNTLGSAQLGNAIGPIIAKAIEAEGYRLLPPQAKPVVMNVKGASASGKSSMRGLQRDLAERLGLPWEDFALISPDYWRKFLLDYDSLGPMYKYAAILTGHELAIVDKKLDRYMTQKASQGLISHLLLDRFRFDSFSPEQERAADSRLLSRFGDTIYLFFMITPPEATVERAWTRGLKTGRYKAVDDLLFHNVEAFTGMPRLFFSWALLGERRVHYEFLDNSVPLGTPPRTIASGWNGAMNVYDVEGMLKIERFKNINVDASQPSEVYLENEQGEDDVGFLKQCAERLDQIRFVNPESGEVFGVIEKGRWVSLDRRRAGDTGDADRILERLEATESGAAAASTEVPDDVRADLAAEQKFTVGARR